MLSYPAFAQVVRGGALPPNLPLFPPDNWWNVDVSAVPVDPGNAGFISFINLAPDVNPAMHPDFGGDNTDMPPEIYGMVYMTVPGNQPLEPVAFDYANQSDYGAPGRPNGYPIPVEAKTQTKWIEGGYAGNAAIGGDKHMLIVDRDNRVLFETWNTRCVPAGSPSCSWQAGSGAIFALDSNAQRPDTWTSADAAGLAILPGLVRYDEVYGPDPIRHAFRVTLRRTRGKVYPATHEASTSTDPNALPMGARLRLKSGTNISSHPAPLQKIFQAMKTYGLIVADNGADLYVQGTYDTRWDNGILNPAFASLTANDFEVLTLGWKPTIPPVVGPSLFYTLPPCRVSDTRLAAGPYGGPALPPNGQRVLALASQCGVPAGAKAISANVAVVQPSVGGMLRFFGGDAQPSPTTTVIFAAQQTRANNLVLRLSTSGTATLGVENQSNGFVHLVVDVNGYFQ